MGVFDWFRKKPQAGADDVAVRVPDGFVVQTWPGELDAPSFTQMDGGVWLASTGPGTDHGVAVLRTLFEAVEAAVRRPLVPVHLVDGAPHLSELVGAGMPATSAVNSVVIWTLQARSLEGWTDDPERLQELLRRFARIARARGDDEPTRQAVLVRATVLAETPWVFHLLRGLGLPVRELPHDGVALIEVRRPDGTVVSAIPGAPFPELEQRIDDTPLRFHRDKHAAEARGDRAAIERIEQEERKALARAIPDRRQRAEPRAFAHAPLLRSLLTRAATTSSAASWEELCRYLIERETAFVVVASPSPEGHVTAELGSLPDGTTSLTAYPDTNSASQLADPKREGRPLMAMARTPLFALVLDAKLALVLGTPGRDGPLQVVLGVEAVRAVAENRVPPAPLAPREYLLYPSPNEVTSLPRGEVGPFILARLTEQVGLVSPDLERVMGLGQLARRLGVEGIETALTDWLERHRTANGHDAVGLFLMGYWPTQPRVSRPLVDALIRALATYPDQDVRDSAVFGLRIAHDIERADAALAARIRDAYRPLWPLRASLQHGVQEALAHVLGP
jgi:hypothetical protein